MYGRYQIVTELGKGTMGTVYKARDPNLDLFVALKVLHKDRVDSENFVKRFLKEAKVLGRLDRANIVRVFNVEKDEENVYIAMELVEGKSLHDIMKKKKFSQEEIVKLGITIAKVLDYAHQMGVIHRDIKPSNILIRSDNFLKITDFGIAHIQDPEAQEKTQAGEILGTPAYMSPEQVQGMSIDGRSDLFSLGIILYELCTGTRPFKGKNISAIFHDILHGKPAAIKKVNPSIRAGLSQIIMKCLKNKPEDRYQSGRQLADALKGCLIDQQSETVVIPAQGSQRNIKSIVSYALAIFLTVTLLGVLWYYLYPPTNGVKPTPTTLQTPIPPPPPVFTSLKVDSSPSGAQVFIDGMFKGNTPLRMELPVGKHEVRLTTPDYYDWEAQVKLMADKETPLNVRLISAN